MRAKISSLKGYTVATKPIRLKLKMKSGETISIKATQTYLKKGPARLATKKK